MELSRQKKPQGIYLIWSSSARDAKGSALRTERKNKNSKRERILVHFISSFYGRPSLGLGFARRAFLDSHSPWCLWSQFPQRWGADTPRSMRRVPGGCTHFPEAAHAPRLVPMDNMFLSSGKKRIFETPISQPSQSREGCESLTNLGYSADWHEGTTVRESPDSSTVGSSLHLRVSHSGRKKRRIKAYHYPCKCNTFFNYC